MHEAVGRYFLFCFFGLSVGEKGFDEFWVVKK